MPVTQVHIDVPDAATYTVLAKNSGLVHLDTDAGSAWDEVVPISGDGNSNSKLTVVTPDVGTRVDLYCNGTTWALTGQVVGATVPSFADQ